jgi:glutamyl-tRNA reductase
MSAEGFFVIGATHHRAPIEVREKLSLAAATAESLRTELPQMPGLHEFAMLNTCNRIEFYGVASDPDVVGKVTAAFCSKQNFDHETFGKICLRLHGHHAVQHLVEVAAGLDSQMLGETEIFGQIKDAYAVAQERRSTGRVLNRLFQKGFQAAKHVRTQTAITEGQVSIANVAVDLALTIFGGLAQTRILLLGAGDIGEKTAKAFQSRGAAALTVASRRLEHAMELATALGASAMPFEQTASRLSEFDVVVCATAAPTAVVTHAAAEAAIRKRPVRPLFFIDLALPRDVEPSVSKLENVFVYNLDDLAKIAETNRAAREVELVKARAIVAEKAAALWQQVEPHVAALRGTARETFAGALEPAPRAPTGS